jgi:hypothetical protein
MTDDGASADVLSQVPGDRAPKPAKSAATNTKAAAAKKTSQRNQPSRGTKKSAAAKAAASAKTSRPESDAKNAEDEFKSAHSG